MENDKENNVKWEWVYWNGYGCGIWVCGFWVVVGRWYRCWGRWYDEGLRRVEGYLGVCVLRLYVFVDVVVVVLFGLNCYVLG